MKTQIYNLIETCLDNLPEASGIRKNKELNMFEFTLKRNSCLIRIFDNIDTFEVEYSKFDFCDRAETLRFQFPYNNSGRVWIEYSQINNELCTEITNYKYTKNTVTPAKALLGLENALNTILHNYNGDLTGYMYENTPKIIEGIVC